MDYSVPSRGEWTHPSRGLTTGRDLGTVQKQLRPCVSLLVGEHLLGSHHPQTHAGKIPRAVPRKMHKWVDIVPTTEK
ncbi:hypothetical protein E1301_Tti018625 [Triplophysa tibetana]|uniref:Uncharacterized protein n=1 Tax=Triplophysa tibetana TaxID=1572043 RepID=A0A5A9NTP3_9TELE|nr:hypothetical protein E1301_Tti018625 [Triplophysa tibetana]